jgi:hypothetical protein
VSSHRVILKESLVVRRTGSGWPFFRSEAWRSAGFERLVLVDAPEFE